MLFRLCSLLVAFVTVGHAAAQEPDIYPPKPGVRFVRQQWVPMRDGTRLATSLFLPAKEGKYPVVLMRTAYSRLNLLDGSTPWPYGGYVFISQDVRGRYDSEGTYTPLTQEADDTPDTIAWIRKQPWCDGRVGMMGPSYLAIAQYQGVAFGSGAMPDSLVPTFAGDGWDRGFYSRGVMALFLAHGFFVNEGGRTGNNTLRFYDPTKLMRQLPLSTMDTIDGSIPSPHWRTLMAHPSRDDHWKTYSIREHYTRFTMPTLQVGGWYDYYPAVTLRHWNGMVASAKTPTIAAGHRVIIGPWGHNHGLEPTADGQRAIDFGPDSTFVANRIYRTHFDRVFKGITKPGDDDAPVRIFVMGRNQWRSEREWPLARAKEVQYYLHSGGKANTLSGDGRLTPAPPTADEPADHYDYDPAKPVMTRGGNHSVGPWNDAYKQLIWCGPTDQRPTEARHDVLVYTGDVLERELEVTGPVRLRFTASSSARDTDFVARLVDVHPDGKAINITEGVVRARYRNGDGSKAEMLTPGEPTEFDIDLQVTSNVFLKGHRLRLDLTSSNFPLWDRNLNTGGDQNTSSRMEVAKQTLFHTQAKPAVLTLSVVPEE